MCVHVGVTVECMVVCVQVVLDKKMMMYIYMCSLYIHFFVNCIIYCLFWK